MLGSPTPLITTEAAAYQRVHAFTRRNWRWIVGLALTALVLPRMVHFGYVEGDKRQTIRIIEQFHARMNAGRLDDIYDDADPVFQNSASREEFIGYITENQGRYGVFENVNSSRLDVMIEAPVRIRAVCKSRFEKSDATEVFAFIREGDEIKLSFYSLLPGTR